MGPHLILDGTLIETDRVREKKTSRKGREIHARYSGKAHHFAGLLQALMNPHGVPPWISDVLPGSVHDITAARGQVLAALQPYPKDLPVLAACGHEGAGPREYTPVKAPRDGYEPDVDTRTHNRLLRATRCQGGRGFALLT